MKWISALVLFFAVSSQAAEINSVIDRIDLKLRLYEVCGTVSPAGDYKVTMIADAGTKNAGHFVTTTTSAGHFCNIIRVFGTKLDIKAELNGKVVGSTQKAL